MAEQTITLRVPDNLYNRLKREADESHLSIEEQALAHLAATLPPSPALPAELEAELAEMREFSDDALWRAARTTLPARTSARIAALNRKRQRGELDAAGEAAQVPLMRQYDRVMLVRAQAAALLKERGYDVSELISPS